MANIIGLLHRINAKRQIKKNLKSNGFNHRQFKKSLKQYQNRELDIHEILSREYSENVVIDAYEYCMRKCNWDPSVLKDGSIKDFLLCVVFDGEVGNGGISQFLSDSSGDMCEETLTALKKLDDEYANLLIEALKYFPDGIAPKDRNLRNDLMDQFNESIINRIDELDQIAYEHEMSRKVYDYLMAHKSDFLDF